MTPIPLGKSVRLLFIGDSITDCGWKTDPDQLGQGYVRIVRDWLAARDPAVSPVVLNRGISGNKIPDLQARWQRDVLELSPDILSIYIGINDVWHGLRADRTGCSLEAYVAGYQDILGQVRTTLPRTAVVLCEPSVLWLEDSPGANDKLKPYVRAVHALAEEFEADCVVGLHNAFTLARQARPDIAWTQDGVHPTSTGHMLIAQEWLNTTGLGMVQS